jgi:Domain of unknown function (DUF1843)
MATKKASKKQTRIRPLYAVPIYDVIESGDATEMKAMAAEARKHVTEVKAAIAQLEKKMKAS